MHRVREGFLTLVGAGRQQDQATTRQSGAGHSKPTASTSLILAALVQSAKVG